jgi:hypothetical protein
MHAPFAEQEIEAVRAGAIRSIGASHRCDDEHRCKQNRTECDHGA